MMIISTITMVHAAEGQSHATLHTTKLKVMRRTCGRQRRDRRGKESGEGNRWGSQRETIAHEREKEAGRLRTVAWEAAEGGRGMQGKSGRKDRRGKLRRDGKEAEARK